MEYGNATKINGVELPDNLVAQLKQLGLELAWYNSWQLEAAVQATKVDCQLVEEAHGTDFIDKLELSHAERLEAERSALAYGQELQAAAG